MNCRYVSRTQPRVLPGRHHDPLPEAHDDGCGGCLPCPDLHCPVDGHTHTDQGATCPECIAATRDNLLTIATLCDAIPTETIHRGITSEAAMLWGPTADPQAWRYQAITAMIQRVAPGLHVSDCDGDCWGCYPVPHINPGYLDDCRDEAHPVYVLGTWEQLWREHLDQPTDLTATLPRIVAYLDRQMHVMAAVLEVPFEDFAGDVRRCRNHLEEVLHDQAQGDRAGVGCFECGHDLERRLTPTGFEDHWTCRGCKRRYSDAEYNFALRASLEAAKEVEA